ncbi:MAG TPA: cyclase family protein, partial [Candidatus Polarisedimenticolia bacterium]|nr:cyclase family protein [Candidatus Polarisedimenticolia bacterium]
AKPPANAAAQPPAASVPDRPPAEPGPFRAPDLVELTTLDPTIKLDIHYARKDNFTGAPVYSEARAFLQRPAAAALLRAHRALRERGYGLLIFDGYRPWSVTRRFWELTPADKKVFVADPAKGSKHNRGCAVDLSMYDLKTGREVAMPSPYDDMTDKAYATYSGGDAAARDRREILREAMENEGFFVYTHEWWHFDYKDWHEYPILDVPFSAIPAVAAASTATAAASPPGGSSAAPGGLLDLGRSRLLDLTWTFDATTLYWPTSPTAFELKQLAHGPTEGGYFYAANTFCAPEHGGTHLDAPIHFSEKGWTADQIPLERLIAPGIVVDVTQQAAADADYRLKKEDLATWEQAHGRVPKGSIVLLRTGWGRRWPDRARYFGDANAKDATHLHFPGYGEEAARLLVTDRQVAALGIDTPSIDYGPSKDFRVHLVALGANVVGLENVAHLEEVPPTGALIVALPVKIGGGSGGPLRLAAIVPAADAATARAGAR